jgi:hypothetical protein
VPSAILGCFRLPIGESRILVPVANWNREGGKKFCEVGNTPGLALPFFSRDDDGHTFAVKGNGLRAA